MRRFEHGIVLYNPESREDASVPLGAEYVDPWGEASCLRVRSRHMLGQAGALLVVPSAVVRPSRRGATVEDKRELKKQRNEL
mmetsp:Transcript_30714/g.61652  ORF Transcript_30714/g.61652 Transcript_30714/m.61652 type:complete len:82 (+) Transcript_30714:1762-2007(+)